MGANLFSLRLRHQAFRYYTFLWDNLDGKHLPCGAVLRQEHLHAVTTQRIQTQPRIHNPRTYTHYLSKAAVRNGPNELEALHCDICLWNKLGGEKHIAAIGGPVELVGVVVSHS